jgi:MinD-like ATPase involved in chromosome partitioning or flagellar assembly
LMGAAPLAAFVGTTPNIGTTAAAFAAAFRIAEATGKSVGYLCLNLKSAKIHRYIGVDEPAATLDKLRPELRSYTLTPDKLRRAAYPVHSLPHLQVLFGNLLRDQAEFFTPEEAEHLLEVAAQAFSFVVLDVGAYWDNAATICSLRRADTRVLVTTPALSHFSEDGKRWIGQVSPLFGVERSQYMSVVVKNPWKTGAYQMKHICKELGVDALGKFQMSELLFSQLDSGTYGDWLHASDEGKQAMRAPAKALMQRHGLRSMTSGLGGQPWYRKLLAHRDGTSS